LSPGQANLCPYDSQITVPECSPYPFNPFITIHCQNHNLSTVYEAISITDSVAFTDVP